MTGSQSREDAERREYKRFVYPGTDVLVNLGGYRDRHEYIAREGAAIFARISSDPGLRSSDAAAFARAAAKHIGDLNALHPFIEGNGRMQRVWLEAASERAGYTYSSVGVTKEAWYDAAAASFERGDDGPMADLILAHLRRADHD